MDQSTDQQATDAIVSHSNGGSGGGGGIIVPIGQVPDHPPPAYPDAGIIFLRGDNGGRSGANVSDATPNAATDVVVSESDESTDSSSPSEPPAITVTDFSTTDMTLDEGDEEGAGEQQTHEDQQQQQNEEEQQQQQQRVIKIGHFSSVDTNSSDPLDENNDLQGAGDTTVERWEKYSDSEVIFHRQIVARNTLNNLHELHNEPGGPERVLRVFAKLSLDPEASVRSELMEIVPQMSLFCFNHSDPCLNSFITQHVLSMIEHYLSDSNPQVRKITHQTLICLLEQNIISYDYLKDKILPVLLELTSFNNTVECTEYRVEAILILTKLLRFLGKEATIQHILFPFINLCQDDAFHVRRICASSIGEYSCVVGTEMTQEVLLPHFRRLCMDSIWSVRKGCADVFVPVSVVCTNEVRREELAPLFVTLLCDNSRWVKTAAFQTLGQFISTFADPTKTGLHCTEQGIIALNDDIIKESESPDSGRSTSSIESDNPTRYHELDIDDSSPPILLSPPTHQAPDLINEGIVPVAASSNSGEQIEVTGVSDATGSHVHVHLDENSFNQFQYWRAPIPAIDLDIAMGEDGKPTTVFVTARMKDEKHNVFSSNLRVKVSPIEAADRSSSPGEAQLDGDKHDTSVESVGYICKENGPDSKPDLVQFSAATARLTADGAHAEVWELDSFGAKELRNDSFDESAKSSPVTSMSPRNQFEETERLKRLQNIIPSALLEHFLSMIDPAHYQNIDPDLSLHCAYAFPAVAFTLGRKFWPCLRGTYTSLSSDMQWKVRWTLACSMHQMAVIVGPEYTVSDLKHIFCCFLKDLDEVRQGILSNLTSFIRLLPKQEQKSLLPQFNDFLKMDNVRNWRFRYALAEQLMKMSELYNCEEIDRYLLPMCMHLINDKVAEVRKIACLTMATLLTQVYACTDESLSQEAKADLFGKVTKNVLYRLCFSPKWTARQCFVQLCECLAREPRLPLDENSAQIFEQLFARARDPVPNVRLSLARCLVSCLHSEVSHLTQDEIESALKEMADEDKDTDVRTTAANRMIVPFQIAT